MLYLITKEVFYILLTALVIFSVMEIIAPNIVQAYINLNLILILWLISSIILIMKRKNY